MRSKRRSSTAGLGSERTTKRQMRRSTKFQSSPVGGTTSSQKGSASFFDRLPSEIINEIWQLSREPALIHTNRRLYQMLPSYKRLTKCMAAVAFIAQPCHDSNLATIFTDLLVPIPGVETPHGVEVHVQLQREVLTSKWFGPELLRIIFQDISTRVVRFEMVSSNYFPGGFSLTEGQQRKLNTFLRKADPLGADANRELRLRAKCAAGDTINIGILPNHIHISQPHDYPIVIPMADLHHIPDDLLAGPFTSKKRKLIEMVTRACRLGEIPEVRQHGFDAELICSEDRLIKALEQIVSQTYTIEHFEMFLQLLEVDRVCLCGNPKLESTVSWNVLCLAATYDQPKYLFHIFAHWTVIAKLACSPSDREFGQDTARFQEIRNDLQQKNPLAKSLKLLDAELEVRQLWTKLERSLMHHQYMRRSRVCPFIVEIVEGNLTVLKRALIEEYPVGNLGEILEEVGILRR